MMNATDCKATKTNAPRQMRRKASCGKTRRYAKHTEAL